MKLEAGKTYVFIDAEFEVEYSAVEIAEGLNNIKKHYRDGFLIEAVQNGNGLIGGEVVIGYNDLHIFKEKEVEPFDISKYKFSDGEIESVYKPQDKLTLTLMVESGYSSVQFNKQDVEMMAKHFGLIG